MTSSLRKGKTLQMHMETSNTSAPKNTSCALVVSEVKIKIGYFLTALIQIKHLLAILTYYPHTELSLPAAGSRGELPGEIKWLHHLAHGLATASFY